MGMTLLFLQYIVYIWNKIDALKKGNFEEQVVRVASKIN